MEGCLMRRLVAAVATAAFLAACSDSSTTAPRSGLQPGGRLAESDPPPPPLSGAGEGFLSAFGGDFATTNTATVTSSALPVCSSGHGFAITYVFKYLQNNTLTNEMAHLDISGVSLGQVTMHDLLNGRTDAKGRVTDADFAFDITDGDGELSATEFAYSVSGTLTNLHTGAKCQAAGSLTGSLIEIIG
jgi:hypothetical protein